MFELYHLANDFFQALISFGDWLVVKPFAEVVASPAVSGSLGSILQVFDALLPALGFSDGLPGILSDLGLGGLSLASFIFGFGLLFVIVFKIVKFFTDIVL